MSGALGQAERSTHAREADVKQRGRQLDKARDRRRLLQRRAGVAQARIAKARDVRRERDGQFERGVVQRAQIAVLRGQRRRERA